MTFNLPSGSTLINKSFTFGVATASFQIEGSNRADGRTECIWDRFCATPGKVEGGDDGSVACDHYNRLEEDLDLIASLGVDAYRFSVSWPRIEPTPGVWNEKGFDFYERLIDGLIKRNIKPFLTLYHWDLPQYLEDKGGWINRETAYHFAEYASRVTQRFGNKVISYTTFNEPWCSAFLGYHLGYHAPGLKDVRLGYQAAHHLLLAHGLALPKMRKNAPESTHGIVLNFHPSYAATSSEADKKAMQLSEDNSHWFVQPILEGTYPASVTQRHPEWAPIVVPGDLEIISAPIDFLGVNYYSRGVVKAGDDGGIEHLPQDDKPKTDIGWEIYPDALTDLLVGFKDRYANLPPIYITENGACDNTPIVDGEINDTMRDDYYQSHLLAVHNAVEAGVNVKGYFAWSLMDNFEWAFGYSMRFGIVHVDYETQVRTLKKSAKRWQSFLTAR